MSLLTKDYVLRPYQERIIEDLSPLKSFALYMGTGTGKTLTSLHLYFMNPTKNLLIVCPKSVVSQWKDVIRNVAPSIEIVDYPKSWSAEKVDAYLEQYKFKTNIAIVINFEISYRLKSLKHVINPNYTIIVDEIHRIKNWGTPRKPVLTTHALVALSYLTDYKIGLTATPTQGAFGGYIDYYPQFLFLGYTQDTYKEFYDRYVVYKEMSYGTSPYPIKKITGYKNTHELEGILSVMARRYVPKYEDFEPMFNPIYVDRCKNYPRMVREKVYKDIMLTNSARTRIARKTIASGTIMGYDMESNYYEYVDNTEKLDWLSDFLQDTDEVVAIFYTYNVELRALKALMDKLGKKYVMVNGQTKDKYYEINNKEYDVVLGQYQAMSESLDGLHHKCHIEIFFSMPESSLLYKQALGRIDRLGQKKPPMYYFLIMKDTIDEAIYKMIENKIEFSESILEKIEV